MGKLLILTLCFIVLGSTVCFAESEPINIWEVGTEASYILYDEPNVMEEEGIMYGIDASYIYHKGISGIMLRGDGRFSYGQVDYSNSGTIDNIDDYIVETRGLVGYDFLYSEATIITPYTGFGYRYLNDDTSGMTSSTGARGYERESNYFYTPLGIETDTIMDNGWSIGVAVEYDHLWKGIQKSHLSDADPSFNDLENNQDKGFGARASIRFLKTGEKVDYLIEPFIRYWDIEESKSANITYAGVLVGFGYEPENSSTEIGIKFAMRF